MRLLLVVLGSAAATIPLAAQAPRIRDSSGVQIVENAARAKAPIAFTAAPLLVDLGGVHDNPDDDFLSNSGDLQGTRLRGGGYIVADGQRLRFFDARGKQTRTVGRKGEGPGEYQMITGVCLGAGDSLFVGDARNARISVYDKAGTAPARSIPMRDAAFLTWDGCFADGVFGTSAIGGRTPDGLTRVLNLYRPDGSVLGRIGPFWSFAGNSYVQLSASVGARGRQFVYGDPRRSEWRVFGLDGTLVQIVRTADPLRDVTSAETSKMKPIVMAMVDGKAQDASPKPATWPAYGQMMVDETGRVWIEDFRQANASPTPWTAFDASGRMIGRVEIPVIGKPGSVRVKAFHRDAVQIQWRDEDGAAHLRWYALTPVK